MTSARRIALTQGPCRSRKEHFEWAFVADLERQDLAARIAALRRALLVLHAPNDTVVGIDNASRIFLAAKHPKSFGSLDDDDHLLTRAVAPESAVAEGVRVAQAAEGRFATDTQAGKHRLFLLAALGACTAMTLRLYAERNGLPLEHIAVGLRHERIHAAACADCEKKQGHVDRIERTIALEGTLDEASRARLLKIADKRPVHRTLQSEVRITTELLPRPTLT